MTKRRKRMMTTDPGRNPDMAGLFWTKPVCNLFCFELFSLSVPRSVSFCFSVRICLAVSLSNLSVKILCLLIFVDLPVSLCLGMSVFFSIAVCLTLSVSYLSVSICLFFFLFLSSFLSLIYLCVLLLVCLSFPLSVFHSHFNSYRSVSLSVSLSLRL